jgi:hypothetical protein
MAATRSMLLAPPEPASTQPVMPSSNATGDRGAWLWVSIRPL